MQLSKLHLEVLPENVLEIWPAIIEIPQLTDFYLAGGTALALQLGHRQSVDLDFFTTAELNPQLPYLIGEILKKPVKLISNWPNALDFSINEVKITLWNYHFPVLEAHHRYQQLSLATPASIGLFKLVAITSRSTWKDIVDLYFVNQIMPLSEILEKFKHTAPKDFLSIYAASKKLLEDEDLADSPKPLMLQPLDLEEAKRTVVTEVLKGIKQNLSD